MLTSFVARIRYAAASGMRKARRVMKEATRPLPLLTGLVTDLARSRKELLAENALPARIPPSPLIPPPRPPWRR